MPTCVPVKDMRDTANFLKLIKGVARPVVVTKNGYDECVVMTSAEYERLVQAEERAQLYLALLEAELDGSQGNDRNAHEAVMNLRSEFRDA